MKPVKYSNEYEVLGKRNCLDKDGNLVEDDGFITLYPPMRPVGNQDVAGQRVN